MPEKHDLLAAILAAKEQNIREPDHLRILPAGVPSLADIVAVRF